MLLIRMTNPAIAFPENQSWDFDAEDAWHNDIRLLVAEHPDDKVVVHGVWLRAVAAGAAPHRKKRTCQVWLFAGTLRMQVIRI
jgi:hypothetical protein